MPARPRGARTTGIRLCSAAHNSFGSVVTIAKLRTRRKLRPRSYQSTKAKRRVGIGSIISGSALMMFGAGALMLALVEVGNSGEMATIVSLAAGGMVALLALAAHERGAAEPILPLKLWRDRVIAVGSLSGFTGGMVMMSINAFLPLYVQGAMGRSPAAAGLALGAASVSWTFASVVAGRR